MRDRLATVFAKRDDPYAGADLGMASRFGGALYFLGALFTAVLLAFVAPDRSSLGDAGWIVAAGVIVGCFVIGARMRTMGAEANVDELLLWSYCAISAVALLVWVSGGVGSPYMQLFLLSLIWTTAVHPGRRGVVYLVVFTALVLLPLAYDDADHTAGVALVTELVLWLTLGFAIIVLMGNVRAQRLGLRREGETARRQARLDQLTGLLNRRAFDEDLAAAIERSRASGDPLSVLVGDLDEFKDFNDRFGHLEGDGVLKAVAEALAGAVRRPDVAYRWGGDEFAVILPQADLAGAELVAQRIESAVAELGGPDGEPLRITTGAAEFDREDGRPASLVDAADRALLLAKSSGAFDAPHAQG